MKSYIWILIGVVAVIFITIISIVVVITSGNNLQPTPKSEDDTLTILRAIDNDEVFDEVINSYRQENPELKIKVIKVDLLDYELNSINSLLSDDPPDIWSIPSSWIARHQDKLSPVPTGLFDKDPQKAKNNPEANLQAVKESFAPIVAEESAIENQVYGLPLFVDTLALVVNKKFTIAKGKEFPERTGSDFELLDQGPRYWSEFIKMAQMLTKKDQQGNITQAGAAIGSSANVANSVDILSTMMLQNKTPMASNDRTMATFNLSQKKTTGETFYPGREALDLYTSFANPQNNRYVWDANMVNDLDAFNQEKVAMIFAYSYQMKEIFSRNPRLIDNCAFLPFPQIEGSDSAIDAGYLWIETVPKVSQHQAEAWQFLMFLVKNGLGNYLTSTERPSPVIKSEFPSLEQRIESRKRPWTYAQQTARAWYRGPDPREVNTIFKQMISSANQGESVANAIDLAASNTTETYRKTL